MRSASGSTPTTSSGTSSRSASWARPHSTHNHNRTGILGSRHGVWSGTNSSGDGCSPRSRTRVPSSDAQNRQRIAPVVNNPDPTLCRGCSAPLPRPDESWGCAAPSGRFSTTNSLLGAANTHTFAHGTLQEARGFPNWASGFVPDASKIVGHYSDGNGDRNPTGWPRYVSWRRFGEAVFVAGTKVTPGRYCRREYWLQ